MALKRVTVSANGAYQSVKPGGAAIPAGDYVLSVQPVAGGLGFARFAIDTVAPAADDATMPLKVNEPWPINIPLGSELFVLAEGVDLYVHLAV